jgi:hypothetical protein
MKPHSKRRRTNEELKAAKAKAEAEKEEFQLLRGKVVEIETAMKEKELNQEEAKKGSEARKTVQQLLAAGIIRYDADGWIESAQQADVSSQSSRNVTEQLRSKKKSGIPVTAPKVPPKANVQQ